MGLSVVHSTTACSMHRRTGKGGEEARPGHEEGDGWKAAGHSAVSSWLSPADLGWSSYHVWTPRSGNVRKSAGSVKQEKLGPLLSCGAQAREG